MKNTLNYHHLETDDEKMLAIENLLLCFKDRVISELESQLFCRVLKSFV